MLYFSLSIIVSYAFVTHKIGLTMVTLRQVEAFRAIMVTGSVTQAAAMLFVSQPAVSRILADLEEQIGFKLFTRANRQLFPTNEGNAFFDEVERAFVGLEQLDSAAVSIRECKQGRLRLITIPSLTSTLMAGLIARFSRTYPDISVSLEVQASQRVFEWVVSQQCDLGFSTQPIDNPTLSTRVIARGDAVCILPRDHRLVGADVIGVKDLKGERFISFKSDSVARHAIDRVFKDAGCYRDIRMEARTTDAVCGMVAVGLGVSVIGPVFDRGQIHHNLVVKPFEPAIPSELVLLFPANRPASRVSELFIEIVEEFLSESEGSMLIKP